MLLSVINVLNIVVIVNVDFVNDVFNFDVDFVNEVVVVHAVGVLIWLLLSI